MKCRLLFLLAVYSLNAYGQAWSSFIDSSRAIDWANAGFSIPNYTVNCPIQPSLTANQPAAAAANTAAIQRSLASCNASHNVVNIPGGRYYVAGWTYAPQGRQVVRGAGPMSTTIYLTAVVGCSGLSPTICMVSNNPGWGGGADVLPPGGSHQCRWTGGYAKGTTTITLSRCGDAPPVHKTLVLDQANDSADTNGIYICDSNGKMCAVESPGNRDGRVTDGVTHSQKQLVYVTGVTSLGNGSYSVAISPGVYFNNIRASQTPGAWWPGLVQNDGLESLTLDRSLETADSTSTVAMNACYQCWLKNVRSLHAASEHVLAYLSANDVIRDSYFYQSQSHASRSYGVELESSSGVLVENNIFQQVTTPLMFGQASGSVVSYNFSIDNPYLTGEWAQTSSAGHNGGNGMNLWEGNSFFGIWSDDSWGASPGSTLFRNLLVGFQRGKSESTYPVSLESWSRAFNIVGNIIGQPGYQTNYESYSTSPSGGVNGGEKGNKSIYVLGWTGRNGVGGCAGPPVCDPRVRTTLMRWGNYDTVTLGVRWDSAEASPTAVPYVSANFTASYFRTLPHTLPASLYYHSRPSWWPASKAWPPLGPDVTSGNLGICSGSYEGAQATKSAQCKGGSWRSVWAGHANSIPAQDCYLNVMHGPPDGTGNLLSFDADLCYGAK